jgi:hypothetical protein
MEIQVPHSQEKRQFGSLKISEPSLCQVYVPQSRKLLVYRGLIKNISLGGIYFVCDEKPPLKKDDIRYLIFNVIYNYHKLYRLKFHGLVVNIEIIGSQFGVALKLISDPIYYPLKDIDDNELPFLDKTRILYQNYELYRRAYEVIKTTPNIRIDKIDNIKNRLSHNLYQVDPIKLAKILW